jgi:hypothetical protein
VDRADRDNSEDAGEDEEAGNMTIESIISVASTVPQKSALELIPDFAIVRIMTRRNVIPRKLKYAGVPLLVEVKRLPKRKENLRNDTFLRDVLQRIVFAKLDVLKQASYLFRNYPRQETVILIACSGLWWSCRIIHRDDRDLHERRDINLEDPDEEEDEVNPEEDSLDDEADEDEDEGDTSEDELDVIDLPEDAAFGESEEVLLENKFSNALQLGSRASDQRFGLIYQRLQAVLNSGNGRMG